MIKTADQGKALDGITDDVRLARRLAAIYMRVLAMDSHEGADHRESPQTAAPILDVALVPKIGRGHETINRGEQDESQNLS